MGLEVTSFVAVVIVGAGATLITDVWVLFLKWAFNVPSLSFCLVGRWLLHMPEGTFRHPGIGAAREKRAECMVGWIAHYAIGVMFAFALIVVAPGNWLDQPTLIPALLFGVGTVAFPFLLLQPAFGLGVAASRAPRPAQARLKSLVTHVVFGVGLYVCATGVSSVLRTNA